MTMAPRKRLGPGPVARLVLTAIAVLNLVGFALVVFGAVAYPDVKLFDFWREALVNSLPFGLLGITLLLKRPENRMSGLFAGLSLAWSLQLLLGQYGTLSYRAGLGWPADVPAMWLSGVAQTVSVMTLVALFLYFPTGRLLSRAWVPVAAMLAVAAVAQVLHSAVGVIDLAPAAPNPFGLDRRSGLAAAIRSAAEGGGILAILGAVSGLVVRFRASRGIERQQLKWFVFTTVAAVLLLFGSGIVAPEMMEGTAGNYLWALLPASVGTSAAIAVLRYRLYDIDLIVNRALVYGALSAVLAFAYLGLVVLLQGALQPVTRESDLAIAGSTLAVAALFRPLRTRVQSFIDHRFYRRRYDAAETLGEFSTRLRDQVDLDSLSTELVSVVGSTMQPAHLSLWLREPEGVR